MQQTLSIIKPDAVKKDVIGKIMEKFESSGLKIVAARMVHLTTAEAGGFYAVHKERPFFGELVEFMCSGPIVVMVLEGPNAIMKNREIMGATNPKEAAEGTLRALYGTDIGSNAVHGSDSEDTAKTEVSYFFKREEIFSREFSNSVK